VVRFIAGSDLVDAIRDVLGGNNVRCAVAFWGTGAEALLNQASGDQPRIICDVTLGGTSPNALRVLGAPENDRLRYVPSLHAKVYISDRGAIVGSANASQNGVGLDGPPSLIEGGVLVALEDDAYSQAVTWFETHWKASKKVDASALALATKRFRPGRTPGSRSVRPGSLLDLIAADPDRFSDVSIVIGKTPTTQRERDQVRTAVKAKHRKEAKTIDALPDNGMFIGWKKRDLNRWRRTFVELWMPGKRLSVYGREVVYFHASEGAVMSRAYWPSIRQVVGGELPTTAQIAKTDGQMVRQLLDVHGSGLFSANELAAEIERISTQTRS
jgi:hypothetical protein